MARVNIEDLFKRPMGESKAAPGLEEGVWRVCNDYRIKKPERRLVACGDRWRTTKPLETRGLLIELARIGEEALSLGDFEEPIIRFVRQHGLLGLDSGRWQGGPGETVKAYVREIVTARDVVRLYEAVVNRDEDTASKLLDSFACKAVGGLRLGEDDEYYEMLTLEHALVEVLLEITKRVNRLCNVTAIPPRRSHEVSEIRTGWGFDSLVGAAYLQMYWLVGAGGGIVRCEFCGDFIPNPRKNQRFCRERDGMKDKCRRDWNYHHGTGKSSKEALKARRDIRKASRSGSDLAAMRQQ